MIATRTGHLIFRALSIALGCFGVVCITYFTVRPLNSVHRDGFFVLMLPFYIHFFTYGITGSQSIPARARFWIAAALGAVLCAFGSVKLGVVAALSGAGTFDSRVIPWAMVIVGVGLLAYASSIRRAPSAA